MLKERRRKVTTSQVSREYEISQDTLRYYEKIGRIPGQTWEKSEE